MDKATLEKVLEEVRAVDEQARKRKAEDEMTELAIKAAMQGVDLEQLFNGMSCAMETALRLAGKNMYYLKRLGAEGKGHEIY